MGELTPNFSLYKPDLGEQGYADEVNGNFDTIDTQLLAAQASGLPTGGAINDVLKKASATDYDVIWGSTPATTWYIDSGAPDNGEGANGDIYLNTDNGDVYQKVAGAWGSPIGSIAGVPGSDGASGTIWTYGSGAPAGGSGSDGDFYIDTDTGEIYKKLSGTWTLIHTPPSGGGPGRLLGVQRFTTPGSSTYTPTTGTNSIVVEIQGAGGGGGGCAAASIAGQANVGIGGGAGGFVRARLTANFSGGTVTVGAKGTGGAAGNNNGTGGGNSSFLDTSVDLYIWTGQGGNGGSRLQAAPGVIADQVALFTARGTAPTGLAYATTLNQVSGNTGVGGFSMPSLTYGVGGTGGSSQYGKGGRGGRAVGGSGSGAGASVDALTADEDRGAGGGGAICHGNGSISQAGGNGQDGLVIIWEYS